MQHYTLCVMVFADRQNKQVEELKQEIAVEISLFTGYTCLMAAILESWGQSLAG